MHRSEEDHLSRNRPLSGGIRTFFSWLRRSERSSSESISSVGSDRSVASFDFLAPTEYATNRPPLTISTNDPTDTYNKRLYDRDIRRHRDHDMTIHRKYGLLRFEGYDSLPVQKSNLGPRQQRATSECYQRRTPYVPGKRRAPLPPTSVAIVTLPRYKRKRPAPKPPNAISQNGKENYEKRRIEHTNTTTEISFNLQSKTSCKATTGKERLFRDNKSFLKQIFENKKSLNIDTSHVKYLPSISELDKQALEIIEKKKALESTMGDGFHVTSSSHSSANMWICTKCLRKYQPSVEFCVECQNKKVSKADNSYKRQSKIDLNVTNKGVKNTTDEKERLKLMLKEMKNSLPKRSQQNVPQKPCPEYSTLRIGDNISEQCATTKILPNINFKTEKMDQIPGGSRSMLKNSDISSHRVSLKDLAKGDSDSKTAREKDLVQRSNTNIVSNAIITHTNNGSNKSTYLNNSNKCINQSGKSSEISKMNLLSNIIKTHAAVPTSPKISSSISPSKAHTQENNTKKSVNDIVRSSGSSEKCKTASNKPDSLRPLPSTSSNVLNEVGQFGHTNNNHFQENNNNGNSTDMTNIKLSPDDVNIKPVNKNLEMLSYHSRRRNLVSQLEQSISKGDVKTAAEAAAELAKLRLSCSVLSFSSQIVADSPTVSVNNSRVPISPTTTNAGKSDTKLTKPNSKPQNITKTDKNNKLMTSETKEISIMTAKEAGVKPGTSKSYHGESEDLLTIKIWIEDKETARGPVKVAIRRNSLIEDLMQHAAANLGLPIHLQRWIVGNNLCTDNKTPLLDLAGVDFSAPFYLCLVQSECKETCKKTTNPEQDQRGTSASSNVPCSNVYRELINLEKEAIVLNSEPFECEVCLDTCEKGDGVVLRECIHIFCKKCVADAIKHCHEPVVACPAYNCSGTLQEREIRALLNLNEYERWLARGLVTVESGTRNTFHCRTTDCKGWAFCEPGVIRFPCPVCKHTNCIPCQAIHEGYTCEEYKEKLKKAVLLSEQNQIDKETQTFLESLIQRGEALACPECNTIITKKWGCDWIKCFACKTEICWVTKGRRWGPAGKGDTSGGCRCGIDGKRCHPTCSYCH